MQTVITQLPLFLWYFFFFIGGSSNGSDQLKDAAAGHSSASDSDITSLGPRSAVPHIGGTGNGNGSSNGSDRSSGTQTAAAVAAATAAGQQAKDIAGSRQSFKMAMGNPCEMFVDVM